MIRGHLKLIFFLKPIRTDVAKQFSKLNSKDEPAAPRRDGTHDFFTEHREVAAL